MRQKVKVENTSLPLFCRYKVSRMDTKLLPRLLFPFLVKNHRSARMCNLPENSEVRFTKDGAVLPGCSIINVVFSDSGMKCIFLCSSDCATYIIYTKLKVRLKTNSVKN